MMRWEDATVQLIDTPPITSTHMETYITSIVRAADAALLCLDGSSDDAPDETAEVISQLKARKTLLSDRTGFDDEDMSIVHVKTLLVVTRADDPDASSRLELFREIVPTPFETVHVEFDRADSREALRHKIYDFLKVIRVYTKPPGKPFDGSAPFTIPQGGTVEDLALQVHRGLAETLKFARVWGPSAHDGQTVGREHKLCDKDLVELHA
jgi:ribosome-interacting GTPase 1